MNMISTTNLKEILEIFKSYEYPKLNKEIERLPKSNNYVLSVSSINFIC